MVAGGSLGSVGPTAASRDLPQLIKSRKPLRLHCFVTRATSHNNRGQGLAVIFNRKDSCIVKHQASNAVRRLVYYKYIFLADGQS